ncbi:MAG: alpha-amylase [Oceanotoga sp.]|uniref:alpha-amylase family glycosyl hydrolase n=1 Tax=Oceanotoga sp. TaxID=2108366 RepID=UPI002655E4A2|nr:alpha-amylase family glycosyl hydrolase [Oceanotoga sp.]MDN5343206.1 alpha-amylase [Oceanotoga sp.]
MIFYELYLRSFYDSNGDGIGDFKGLEKKLDYLQNIGIDSIWLLPIMKSPAFHGYTITDFYKTNSLYGNIDELKQLLNEAHKRNIKIVLDLPINHVSVSSEWFQKALNDEKPYKNWFIWSNNKTNTDERRHWGNDKIWHKINDKYFYGLFGPGSPDLNFENKELWDEIKKIFKHWLNIGFDGFRLDAAKHIFDYDKKNMKFKYQHDKNIKFWIEMLEYIKSIKKDAIIISEVWDEKEIVKKYDGIFEIGFNFPLSYIIKDSIKLNDAEKFVKDLKEVMPAYFKKKPIKTKSGNFLTNHDMTRLRSELKSIKKSNFALNILLTLPGIPFIYYGEELSMRGKLKNVNFTEDGEEPIQWSEIGFGPGQTEWKGYKFNTPYSKISVEEQHKNPKSTLNRVKKLIKFRKENSWIENSKINILENDKNMVKLSINNEINSIIIHYNFKSSKTKININEDKILYYSDNVKCTENKTEIPGYSILITKGDL